jgi:Phage P22-like portal protein
MADNDIVREAREALELSYQFDRDNRKEAVEDLRFVAGFQWSDSARQERQGRPLITINRSGQFIRQVANPIRQNMPTIKVEPDGDDQKEMAEVVNGIIRRIQYNSSASHVYANAVEHMVACGIGWFRVCQDYTDDNSFNQEILIKRVFNPLSVYPDPSSLEPDRSDMNWCLVAEDWPIEAFKKKWPGKDKVSVDLPNNGSAQQAISWGSADTVKVAEYWRRKKGSKSVVQLSTGHVLDASHLDGPMGEQIRPHVVNQRAVETSTVEMIMVSGAEILEEPYQCPCKWIPVIPVIGAEIPIEQGTYRHGLIRFQREPQQLHNYFMSVAAESLGQQPKAPYLITPKQLGKFKALWDNANRSPTPYLPYEPDPQVPGGQPTRISPPPLPAGLIQMAQMLSDDMKATTGIYDAALGNQSNETSGVAINQRVQQGDQATFHYVDNLEHGLEHLGRVLLDMIPKVYDNERSMRIKGDGAAKEKTIQINKPVMNYDGQSMIHNDMSQMSFNAVRVVLGQNFASRKQQTSQTLIGLIQAMPQIGMVAGDIIAKNLDIDQADELAERLHTLLPPQIQQLEQQNSGQPPPPPAPPSPEQQAAAQEQQAQQQAMQQAQQAHEQSLQLEQQAGQFKLQQEANKAAQAQQAAQTEHFKTQEAYFKAAMAKKKLTEPPPVAASSKA